MLEYSKCYNRYLPFEKELAAQGKTVFPYMPLISIVVPAYETPKKYLTELLDSVKRQSYSNWELCIADGSKTDAVEQTVAEYAAEDARIGYQRLTQNGGISENTNSGCKMAHGEYIALMDHDDILSANALYEMVKCLNDSYSKEERIFALIYSDEDKVNGDGTVHSRPHFKPDFNLEFLRHNNYFCHFLMFSSGLFQKTGGLDREFDGAQDYDFVLRCVDAKAVVRHVPKILYHWRIHEGSTAGNSEDKAYAFDNGCRAIEAHLKRRGEEGRAEVTANLGVYHVQYKLKGKYRITVFCEEEAQLRAIRQYYGTLSFEKKEYSLQIQYKKAGSFFGGIEKACMGDYILYIQKGIEVKPQKLIEILLGSCQHKCTAAAGVKMLTQKKRVASCGYAYDENGRMIPLNSNIPAEYKGYFLHAVIPKNVSILSFGCVMFRRDALETAGEFDTDLTGIYRAADYCFRLSEHGYQIVVIPELTAVQSGGEGKKETLPSQLFYERWKQKFLNPDPCYNSNLSLEINHTYAMKEK